MPLAWARGRSSRSAAVTDLADARRPSCGAGRRAVGEWVRGPLPPSIEGKGPLTPKGRALIGGRGPLTPTERTERRCWAVRVEVVLGGAQASDALVYQARRARTCTWRRMHCLLTASRTQLPELPRLTTVPDIGLGYRSSTGTAPTAHGEHGQAAPGRPAGQQASTSPSPLPIPAVGDPPSASGRGVS